MEVYDLLMLLVLAGATIFGAWKGLAWQVASLSSLIVSYMVAVRFRGPLSQIIDATPPWDRFAAMLILFVGTSLLVWISFRFVSDFIDRLKLKEFDRQIGALFGFAKGVLLCVLVTLFAVTLLGEEQREAICRSRSGFYIAHLLDRAHAVMPAEIHEVVHPYIHSLDDHLGRHRSDGHASGEHAEGDGQTEHAHHPPETDPYRPTTASIDGNLPQGEPLKSNGEQQGGEASSQPLFDWKDAVRGVLQ